MRLSFRFSNRKFYDIISEQKIQILPKVPEDVVLSKYLSLKQNASKPEPKYEISKFEKEKKEKLNYAELLKGSPHGSIQNFFHRNHELTLLSMNYFRVDEQKLHRILYKTMPDIIVVQRRPEYHLHNFQMITKGSDDVFSDRDYLNGLIFTSQNIKPEQKSFRPIFNALNKSKDDMLEQNPQKQVLQQKGFQICKKFSSSYQTPMMFGQMPMRAYRQWIANTHTLMELQQIFKIVCQRLPRYKNISFNPYQMATLIYPDIFMKINDTYMATILQMLIATKKYKKILGLFGIVDNQAVKHILEKNQALKPIIELLIPPGPKGSIVRDIQNFQIIQKQIILDIMFFGKQILDIKTQTLHTTNAVIQKYGKEIDKKTMIQFRYEKSVEYLKIMEEKEKQGEEQIKKQFVRETLREKN